ncbi:HAAS signaling domain-containing protein [Homoserinimonas sp. A447]
MAKSTTPQVVRSYLSQLKEALADLPAEVRDEIVAGVREELDGMDAAAAAARIETLGDPEFIAAEARAEAAVVVPSDANQRVDPRGREPRWLPVLAGLLVAFGGIVIPVIGWIVGLALTWMSKSWRVGDKWIATLTPFIAVGVFIVVFALTSVAPQPDGPSTSDFGSPVMPGMFSALWSSTILVIPVNAVVGIWLLWRARRTWSFDVPPREAHSAATSRPHRPQASWYAPVTVLLIIAGGFVLPVVGWVAGVTMLWAADAWSVRDKWLGTLAGPVAVLVPAGLVFAARLWLPATGGGFDPFLLIVLSGLVLPTVASLLVGIRLLRRSKAATQ